MTEEKWECSECHQINTFNKYGCMGICVGCGRMGNDKAEADSQRLVSNMKKKLPRILASTEEARIKGGNG